MRLDTPPVAIMSWRRAGEYREHKPLTYMDVELNQIARLDLYSNISTLPIGCSIYACVTKFVRDYREIIYRCMCCTSPDLSVEFACYLAFRRRTYDIQFADLNGDLML